MIQIKRLLLLLLVAIAVPVQGAQAVAAGICMTLGHHEVPAQTADHDHSDGSHSHSEAGDAETDEGNAHCGPCVSCCGAATMAAPAYPVLPIVPVSVVQVHYGEPSPGVLSSTLDRPPLAL